jgi:hypothetical protein
MSATTRFAAQKAQNHGTMDMDRLEKMLVSAKVREQTSAGGTRLFSVIDFIQAVCNVKYKKAGKRWRSLLDENSLHKHVIESKVVMIKLRTTARILPKDYETPAMEIDGLKMLIPIFGKSVTKDFRKIVTGTEGDVAMESMVIENKMETSSSSKKRSLDNILDPVTVHSEEDDTSKKRCLDNKNTPTGGMTQSSNNKEVAKFEVVDDVFCSRKIVTPVSDVENQKVKWSDSVSVLTVSFYSLNDQSMTCFTITQSSNTDSDDDCELVNDVIVETVSSSADSDDDCVMVKHVIVID